MSSEIDKTKANAAIRDLWRVAETGNGAELQRLLALGTPVDACNASGTTALMRAASAGRVQMVKLLIAGGANPNAARLDKFTPLMLAAFFGHAEIVRTLVEYGADIKTVAHRGTSARMWAMARTNKEVARYLDVADGRSALPKVERQNHPVLPSDNASRSLECDVPPTKPATVLETTSIDGKSVSAVSPEPVKTLSEPPEIWEVVQEIPREFRPTSAFFSRLPHLGTSVAVPALCFLLVTVGTVLLLLLRGTQVRQAAENKIQLQSQSQQTATAVQLESDVTNESKTATLSEGEDQRARDEVQGVGSTTAQLKESVEKIDLQRRSGSVNWTGNHQRNLAEKMRRFDSKLVSKPNAEKMPDIGRPNASPMTQEGAKPISSSTRSNIPSPASSQLISPSSKSAPKPKVIQWP
jgi:Ankyrin repeats (3 copies)